MRCLLLALPSLLVLAGCASRGARHVETTPGMKTPVAVEDLDSRGRIRLHRGSQRLVVDLGRDISGCKGTLYDRTVNEEYEEMSGASYGLVDETERAPYTYVVLLAWAPPNCNIEGHCGAGGWDSTLIWLKLSGDLKLAGKQALALDDCRGDRSAVEMLEPGEQSEEEEAFEYLKVKDLPWDGDVLRVAYQIRDEKVQRFIYDRRNPDAGFQRAPEGSPAPASMLHRL
jgi:hypothetical protein